MELTIVLDIEGDGGLMHEPEVVIFNAVGKKFIVCEHCKIHLVTDNKGNWFDEDQNVYCDPEVVEFFADTSEG